MKLNRKGMGSMLVIALFVVGLVVLIVMTSNSRKADKDVVSLDEIFSNEGASSSADKAVSAPTIVPSEIQKDPQAAAAVAAAPAAPTLPNIPQEPPAVDENLFAVQIASFRDKGKADAMVAGVNIKDYPVYIESRDFGEKGTWHRVRVGGFSTKEAAAELVTVLKATYKDCFVIKRK